MTSRLPKLIVFDLDYTLWDLWIDTHIDPPIRRPSDAVNELRDRHNHKIAFYRDVAEILHRLREGGVTIAVASRTHTPDLARQALRLLLVPPPPGHKREAPTPAVQFFDHLEIYPGSKIKHFKQLHKQTGLPYSEMLFFDDEHRNKEVESLGVTFCLVPSGVNDRSFEQGLAEWRRRHPVEVAEDAAAGRSTE
ncbi:magnesium-dependent phosphatase-1 [Ganoderma leucocontextum]|nr:magnesium-dependent phosphatase-1 [Ganoderma leucocontextum]